MDASFESTFAKAVAIATVGATDCYVGSQAITYGYL